MSLPPLPKAGDVVYLTRAASVQFHKPIMFRVIRVVEEWTKTTYDGWCWLEGYVLDAKGYAIEKRTLFVQSAGLAIQRRTAPTQPKRSRSKVAG